MFKTHIYWLLAGAAMGGSLVIPFLKPDRVTKEVEVIKWKTKTEIKYVDKVVYKDRVKTKVITRTITKKDGTVIKERESSKDETSKVATSSKSSVKNEHAVSKEKVFVSKGRENTFHMGISSNLLSENLSFTGNTFSAYIGYRFSEFPLFVGPTFIFDRSFNFKGLGVQISWEL